MIALRGQLRAGRLTVDVAFEAAPGITVFVGPSASGKSLTLRALAGLAPLEEGTLIADGQPLHRLPAHRRGFGYAPQDQALWPHRRVSEHLLPFAGAARGRELAEQLGLQELWARFPADLSGGERQRVALARALAGAPAGGPNRHAPRLLLDEPLTALDLPARQALARWVKTEVARLGAVAVWVTHDPQEAQLVADAVVRFRPLSSGPGTSRVEARGAPRASLGREGMHKAKLP